MWVVARLTAYVRSSECCLHLPLLLAALRGEMRLVALGVVRMAKLRLVFHRCFHELRNLEVQALYNSVPASASFRMEPIAEEP